MSMRNKYSEDFRARATQLCLEKGVPAALKELGLGKGKMTMLYRWKKESQLSQALSQVQGDIEKQVVKHSRTARAVESSGHFELSTKVPKAGLIIKLTNDQGMLGTLYVTQTGMRFARANAKIRPTREMSWETFNTLMLSGLLG